MPDYADYPDYTPNQFAATQLKSLALSISSGCKGEVTHGVVVANSEGRPNVVLMGFGAQANRAAAIASLKAALAEMEAAEALMDQEDGE